VNRRTIAGVLLLSLVGCTSRVTLTKDVRDSLDSDDFLKLQCYVSHDITLRRTLATEERDVTPGHVLKIENNKRVEEVVIPAFTPGVIVDGKDDKLMVSFEPAAGGKERFLVFGLVQKWKRNAYYFLPDGQKDTVVDVVYGGKQYSCRNESLWAYLMVDQMSEKTRTKEPK
jgi:hypothetical protein